MEIVLYLQSANLILNYNLIINLKFIILFSKSFKAKYIAASLLYIILVSPINWSMNSAKRHELIEFQLSFDKTRASDCRIELK